MTLAQLNTLLKTLNKPVAYHHFDVPQTPPFIVYHTPDSNDLYADNKNYVKVNRFMVELYTKTKDTPLETSLDNLLDDYAYIKSEDYITSEGLFVVYYELESE